MITITADDIISYHPCGAYPTDLIRELCGPNPRPLVDVLRAEHIPQEDRIWVASQHLARVARLKLGVFVRCYAAEFDWHGFASDANYARAAYSIAMRPGHYAAYAAYTASREARASSWASRRAHDAALRDARRAQIEYLINLLEPPSAR